MSANIVRLSKYLSLVLRHQPGKIGLRLDGQGWAEVDALLAGCNQAGVAIDLPTLQAVVAQNDKQRFSFSPDGTRIRANQGHSIKVDLGLAPRQPPERLYHGTAARFLEAIRLQGLLPGRRQHVHLSLDEATALKVGGRHGLAVVLTVLAGQMWSDGLPFYLSENGVWLAERAPVQYLVFPPMPGQ